MSLHADALAVLTGWAAPDAGQDSLRRDYLSHLRGNPDGLWRSCVPAHITAGGIVVNPAVSATLLVLHGRIGQWVQPGGHCEPGDVSLSAAAAREVREETGLAELSIGPAPLVLSRHRAPCATGADWHLDVQYAVTVPDAAIPTVSDESHDVRWFAVDALPDNLADGVADSVAAAVSTTPTR